MHINYNHYICICIVNLSVLRGGTIFVRKITYLILGSTYIETHGFKQIADTSSLSCPTFFYGDILDLLYRNETNSKFDGNNLQYLKGSHMEVLFILL